MMSSRNKLSSQTRNNWLIDAAVFVGAVAAILSGIYFLFVPSGGNQGGRNAMYGVTVLVNRETWGDLHTWGGVVMIGAVIVHLAIHWGWVKMMTRRTVNAMRSRGSRLSRGAKINVAINLAIALGFLLCAVSGCYFLFAPSGGFQGGSNPGWDPGVLFSRTTWDLIHTWSGVVLIVAAVLHLAIHWRWIRNVTQRLVASLWERSQLQDPAALR
jgi:hypothetical protein